MQDKNIFGLAPQEDKVAEQLKGLETQRKNLEERLRAEGIDPDTLGGDFDNRNLIEKALNLTPDQGLLMDVFEVLNRPVQAVKGALTAGYDGKSLLEGAWEGLSGQKVTSGREVIGGGQEMDLGGVANFIADVGIDIALDPLTYIPAGYFLKGFKKVSTRTATRIFQNGKITQDRILKQLALDYGDDFLKKASATKSDARIYKISDIDYVKKIKDANPKNLSELITDTGYITKKGQEYLRDTLKITDYTKDFTYLRNHRMANLSAGVSAGTKPMVLAEFEGVEELLKAIRGFGDDIDVFATPTTSKVDDIIIGKTYIADDGSKYMVNIGSVEAKALNSGQAFGKRATLKVARTTVNSPGKLAFAEGSPFRNMSQDFQDNFFKVLESMQTTDGRNLGKVMRDFIDNRVPSSTKTIQIYNLVPKNQQTALKALLFDFYKKSGMDLIYATDLAGNKRFFKLEDAFDFIDVKGTQLFRESSGAIAFKGGFSVDFKKLEQSGKYLLTEDIAKKFVQDSMQVNVSILEDIAKRGDFIGATARGLQTVGETIGSFFNATFNFSDFAKQSYKYVVGESNLFVQRQSARLATLKADIIRRYPDAGELITELFESGAYIDEASGAVRVLNRQMHLEDFMGYVTRRVGDGTNIPLPAFKGRNAKAKFLDFLNDISDSATGVKLFDVVESGGATGLKFKGTNDELKTIMQYIKTTGFEDPIVRFGDAPLSVKAEAFLKAEPQAMKDMATLMDDILGTLVKEGGYASVVNQLTGQIGYMRHMMTKGAYEAMQMTNPGVLSKFAKPGSNVLAQRSFLGSIPEINAAMKEFYNLDVDLFARDAFEAMENLIKVTSRNVEQNKMLNIVLTAKDRFGEGLFKVVENTRTARLALRPNEVMIKSFGDEFGALLKNLAPDSQAELEAILKASGFGDNSAIVMNRNAHGLIKRAEKAYQELPKLIKMYDGFLNTWKGLTLISPGFHMRNLFGNMFNSYAVGMDIASQSRYATIAFTELNEYNELVKKIAQGLELTGAEKKIYERVQLFNRQGLVQSHRGVRDLETVKEATEMATKGGFIKNTYNNAIRFNFNVAEKMDDVQRYMLWRWSLDKTGDAAGAARTVTESLFDYTHLTNFEKDVMKRIFPFYTFMKNNFIFQAKNIMRNPKLYARTGRAYKYYLEDIAGYSAEDLPDYATENMWIPIPMSVDKNNKRAIAFLKANLPLTDFTELVENPFKKGVISVSAPIKLPIELGLGRDLFTGAPLQAFPGERNRLAEKTGVFGFLRDERGNLAITQNPLVQKIAADVGLRTPLNYGSVALDALDTLLGYQGPKEGLADFAQRLGLVGVQEMDKLELTKLYQELERLRELKKYYEQETGNQLPLLPRA